MEYIHNFNLEHSILFSLVFDSPQYFIRDKPKPKGKVLLGGLCVLTSQSDVFFLLLFYLYLYGCIGLSLFCYNFSKLYFFSPDNSSKTAMLSNILGAHNTFTKYKKLFVFLALLKVKFQPCLVFRN